MDIEEALSIYLLSVSGLAAIVGDQIHFEGFPEGFSGSGIDIFKVSGPREVAMGTDPGIVYGRIQFTVQAPTYKIAKSIIKQIRLALQNYVGVMGGTGGAQVDYTEFADERDSRIDGSLGFKQMEADWIIAYHE